MVNYEKLIEDVKSCTRCESLFGFKPNPVVHGKKDSKIMQISQAPSKNVHLTSKPFDDKSGAKLKYDWYNVSDDEFYDEVNFYITAMGHCFPGKTKSGGDRLPPKICSDTFLKKEVELVDCNLYILIGSKAARYFFNNEDFTTLVFKENELNGKLCIVLPHPSPLNIKWFKDNPTFESERLIQVRQIVKSALDNNY